LFRENHANPGCAIDGNITPGKPTRALAIWAPTTLFNEDPDVARAAATAYEIDAENADRELGARWVARGTGRWFDPVAIVEAKRTYAEPLPPPRVGANVAVIAAIDPAFQENSFAGVILHWHRDTGTIWTAELFELEPEKGRPLVPKHAVGCFAAVAKRHGATAVWTDIHYIESVREHCEANDLEVLTPPGGSKELVHTRARDALLEKKAVYSDRHVDLANQLRDVLSKPKPGGGYKIWTPKRKGKHGDIASAWTLGVWAATQKPIVGPLSAYLG
ncbi:MAG TPA: hypothetical protein VFB62_10060, partial [Polyangiaceae bacterium]|nr:hypothetical protein [Polyangiaceae bacterium]